MQVKRVFGPVSGFLILEAPSDIKGKRLWAYIDGNGLDTVIVNGFRRLKSKYALDQVTVSVETGSLVANLNGNRYVLQARNPNRLVLEFERERDKSAAKPPPPKLHRNGKASVATPKPHRDRKALVTERKPVVHSKPMVPGVKTVGEGDDVPEDADFRFSKDRSHIVRRSFLSPTEDLTEAYRNVHVAGITFEERALTCDAFIRGRDRYLELRPSPFDGHPNAIKVIGHWKGEFDLPNSGDLGWVPKDISNDIAMKYPGVSLVATPLVMFHSRRGYSPGIRMMIWKPRGTRKCKEDTLGVKHRDR